MNIIIFTIIKSINIKNIIFCVINIIIFIIINIINKIITKLEKNYFYYWKTTKDLIWNVKLKITISIIIIIINKFKKKLLLLSKKNHVGTRDAWAMLLCWAHPNAHAALELLPLCWAHPAHTWRLGICLSAGYFPAHTWH
jgi:hypothetical protein